MQLHLQELCTITKSCSLITFRTTSQVDVQSSSMSDVYLLASFFCDDNGDRAENERRCFTGSIRRTWN
ncbi:Hypothetical predicted protein [Xyrichtys novacula]|uniref:Uncharacterized protein n=1 Tax=Xyrichtys novacula TaxID=13765 RepID=A0AAV1EXW8_XYRNO|nr:Hypothetical predicted protein [Xyrichtys novacula]